MTKENLDFIRTFMRNEAGVVIDESKDYLLESRLSSLAKELQFSSLHALIDEFKVKPSDLLRRKIIDTMTTNETFFFRDPHVFKVLNDEIIPRLLRKRQAQKCLNIWCAASSSGQEPYTIAMILKTHLPTSNDWKIKFIASDISERMLERARAGAYTQFEVNRGLPVPFLVRYFEIKEGAWCIKQELKDMIEFRKINLLSPWSISGIDLLFVRNVMIYFDDKTKQDLFDRFEKAINPGGYLFLGGTETILGHTEDFKRLRIDNVTCYQLKNDCSHE